MTILTWSGFSKRRNSTKQPTAGTSVTCTLKEECSIDNPVFILATSDTSINYVQAFGNYYFVTNIVFLANNLMEIHCEKDVLATYKSQIGAYTAYVSRAASSYDNMLHDVEISQDQEYVQDAEGTRTTLLASVVKQGAYVLRTVGYGGINSYLATEAQVKAVLDFAYTNTTYNTNWLTFFTDNTAAAFADPFKYILDLRWIALTDSQISSLSGRPLRDVHLGYFDSQVDLPKIDPISSYYPTSLLWTSQIAINIPAAYYNDFRDYDPSWASYTIYIPGCGYHNVDPVAVQYGISLDFAIDALTGDVIAQVYSGTADPNRTLLFETKGSAGCPVQIGQLSTNGNAQLNPVNPIGSGLSLMKAETGKLNFLAERLDVPGIPNQLISALVGDQVSVIGSVGSRGCVQYNPDAFMTKRLLKSKDLQTTTLGRPLCQNVQINTLSGYVLCNHAAVPIPGEAGDKSAVNSFLNSGFYYE